MSDLFVKRTHLLQELDCPDILRQDVTTRKTLSDMNHNVIFDIPGVDFASSGESFS